MKDLKCPYCTAPERSPHFRTCKYAGSIVSPNQCDPVVFRLYCRSCGICAGDPHQLGCPARVFRSNVSALDDCDQWKIPELDREAEQQAAAAAAKLPEPAEQYFNRPIPPTLVHQVVGKTLGPAASITRADAKTNRCPMCGGMGCRPCNGTGTIVEQFIPPPKRTAPNHPGVSTMAILRDERERNLATPATFTSPVVRTEMLIAAARIIAMAQTLDEAIDADVLLKNATALLDAANTSYSPDPVTRTPGEKQIYQGILDLARAARAFIDAAFGVRL